MLLIRSLGAILVLRGFAPFGKLKASAPQGEDGVRFAASSQFNLRPSSEVSPHGEVRRLLSGRGLEPRGRVRLSPHLLCLQLDAAAMQDRFGIAIRLLAPFEDEIEGGLEGDGAVEIA